LFDSLMLARFLKPARAWARIPAAVPYRITSISNLWVVRTALLETASHLTTPREEESAYD
jgi:hypothetical protein